jgi:hypothetical protein
MHRDPSLSTSTVKAESVTSTGVGDSASEMSSDIEKKLKETRLLRRTTSLPASSSQWGGQEGVDVGLAESDPFSSDHPPVSRGTDDTGDEVGEGHQSTSTKEDADAELYAAEEDASMSTEPFSISEIGSQEGALEMFDSENVESKADSLLDLGWEGISNLDDMDKLFRSAIRPPLLNSIW